MSVVGFDFGYQNCFIAVARQGGIESVSNEFSDRCNPTFVSFGAKERAMGNSAKTQIISNTKNTIWGWKKFIGRMYRDPCVSKETASLPYEVLEGANGTISIKVQYLGEEQVFSPEQITATMLTKLKTVAEIAMKTKIVDCVINVPCYFTDVERRAMLDSAQIAGLNVLRLMNDTTATALSYGIYKQDLPGPEEKSRNVVFVDLGHSDLQVAACAFNKGKLKMLANAADPNLGGRDMDMVIANHFSEEFKKKYKVDAKTKQRAFIRLMQESEKVKKLMSANSTAIPLNIECFMEDKDVSGRLKREDFEAMAEPIFVRMRQVMESVLDNAKLKPEDIYAVEVVGGATRMPAVKSIVKEVYGQEARTTLNSDESVARGCALQCAILSPTFRVRDFSITDVQPYSITLKWDGMAMDEDNDMEIFERFHPVPFAKMLTFYRKEPFTLEGRYTQPADIPYPDTSIGEFLVDKVYPQPNGESSKVKVKVRVNLHGIFYVSSAMIIERVEKEAEVPKEVSNVEDKKEEKKEVESKGKEEPMDVENGPVENKANESESEKKETTEATQEEQSQGEKESPKKEEGNKENGQDNKEETKEENKGSDKKTKTVTKTVDLPITARVPQLSKPQLNALLETECQMVANDSLEKQRSSAKNGVEEYVYEMREMLYETLVPYVLEADKEKFSDKLRETESWLYNEGEDVRRQVYVDKLASLKKIGDPIVTRYSEHQSRPAAFEGLGRSLQLVRKAVESYNNKEVKYAHLEQADMDKVDKALKEKSDWFDQKSHAASKQILHEDAVVLASDILSQKKSLEAVCNPILSKPKPKPKEEPPKDDKKDSKNGDSQKTEGQGDAAQSQPEEEQKPMEGESDVDPKVDMELD